MENFVIMLFVAVSCQYCASSVFSNFRGSSLNAKNWIGFCATILGYALIGLTIWGCFKTTWWHPIVMYVAGMVAGNFLLFSRVASVIIAAVGTPIAFAITLYMML